MALRILSSHGITLDGNLTASEIVKLSGYYDFYDFVTEDLFPIDRHDPTGRVIELYESDRDLTSEELLKEFGGIQLDRPTYEDAFYFGFKCPEETTKRLVMFPHVPVRHGEVVVLIGSSYWRSFQMSSFSGKWNHRVVIFAGVRR